MKLMLSGKEKQLLIDIARKTLDSYIRKDRIPSFEEESLPEALKQNRGVFVTLYKNEKLRGCIGRFETVNALYKAVQDMTISASTCDHRFKPLTEEELDDVRLEISVLTEPVRIRDISEINLGKHGIYIRKGSCSGTFLPGVAVKTGWNLEEYLGHCARDKAKIGWDGWKDAEIYTYESIAFRED